MKIVKIHSHILHLSYGWVYYLS